MVLTRHRRRTESTHFCFGIGLFWVQHLVFWMCAPADFSDQTDIFTVKQLNKMLCIENNFMSIILIMPGIIQKFTSLMTYCILQIYCIYTIHQFNLKRYIMFRSFYHRPIVLLLLWYMVKKKQGR